MKTCKFCAEQIQDDALKCKHCGEWLEDQSAIKFEKIKDSLSDGIKNLGSGMLKLKTELFGNSEFIEPSDENPLIVDDLILKSNNFCFKGKEYSYDDVASIFYGVRKQTMNMINVGTHYELIIYTDIESNYPVENRLKNEKIRLHQYSNFAYWAPKTNKLIQNAYYILSTRTFSARISKYYNMIIQQGYFTYPVGIKLYNNGKIEKGSTKLDLQKCIDLGTIRSGFNFKFFRTSRSDPYYFSISENTKILSPSIQFGLYYDKDVFLTLIDIFHENKSKFII